MREEKCLVLFFASPPSGGTFELSQNQNRKEEKSCLSETVN
jgi:hypothetical protein